MEEEEKKDDLPKKKVLTPQQRKRVRVKKGSVNYISGKEMMIELRHHKATGEITEVLGSMFLKLATRFTSKPNFIGYSYRDEMISSAVYRMISQISKFDVDHPAQNPFAYFTQICRNQVLSILNAEKKQRDIKDSVRTQIWDEICEQESLTKYSDEDGD